MASRRRPANVHLFYRPQEIIEKTIRRHKDKVVISCSFGKSSTAVLSMAREIDKNVKVMLINTGVEYSESLAYAKRLRRKWKLNLIEIKPKPGVTFWTICKTYGFPEIRSSKSKYHTPRCCYHLKEGPADDWCYDHDIEAVILGLQACESNNRRMLIGRYDNCREEKDGIKFCGQRYFVKQRGRWHINPIAHWSESDVWDYLNKKKVPINPVYQKWGGIMKRQGCRTCTGYIGWQKVLKVVNPKLYNYILSKSVEYKSPWIIPPSERIKTHI